MLRRPAPAGALARARRFARRWRELGGRGFHLSPQRLSLLHHLARRAPGVVRRDVLFLSSLNEDTYGEMLTAQICLLNKVLREHGIPLLIANQRGVGYRLTLAS